jgi:hypothetical protein
MTATPTPTPSPTVAPITWRLQYRTSASGTPTGTKQVNNMSFSFLGVTYTRPNFTWVGSSSSIYTFPTDTNSGSQEIRVSRDLCRQSGASALTLDQYRLRVLVNSIVVFDNTVNVANTTISLCPFSDNRNVGTTSFITVNSGDTVLVEYTDIFT